MKTVKPRYEVTRNRVMVIARNLSDSECVSGMIPAASLAIDLIHAIGEGKFTTNQAYEALRTLAAEHHAREGEEEGE